MAEPTTISQVLPSPKVEASLTTFLKNLDYLQNLGLPIDPDTGEPKFAGLDPSKFKPTIADESALQQQAREDVAGIRALVGPGRELPAGVEAGSIEAFMSPYQQDVIETTLAEFDRQRGIARTAERDAAIRAGAFGGGREGILAGEAASRAEAQRAQLQAQLLAQGFQQAQAARAADLQARQGLGTYQTQLGQAGQAQQQAIKDAAAAAEREKQFLPFTQIGLVGQQLAQVQPGAFPTQTVGYQAPGAPPSPLSTALGVGTGIASIGSKLGLFG
tara:strand:+ start:132 stop:953 length:822 start_codon:yes stop_codon:yes gene_type:complete